MSRRPFNVNDLHTGAPLSLPPSTPAVIIGESRPGGPPQVSTVGEMKPGEVAIVPHSPGKPGPKTAPLHIELPAKTTPPAA